MTPRPFSIAVLQSNYIPWKGYFDIIRSVDLFVVYDDVQFTRRDWRNRNVIKTSQGLKWLTIPVKTKGKYHQRICDTEIHGGAWAEEHWKTIVHSYARSPYFTQYCDLFRETYSKASEMKMLSDVNLLFMSTICTILKTETRIVKAVELSPEGRKGDRILSICRNAGASVYLTGPSGTDYLDTASFKSEGIKICVADYSDYPAYEQRFGTFENNVSVIDLIFNTGSRMKSYMKTFI